jgi:hypothetical protein
MPAPIAVVAKRRPVALNPCIIQTLSSQCLPISKGIDLTSSDHGCTEQGSRLINLPGDRVMTGPRGLLGEEVLFMEDMSPPDHVGPPSAIHDLPGACLLSRRAKAGAAA